MLQRVSDMTSVCHKKKPLKTLHSHTLIGWYSSLKLSPLLSQDITLRAENILIVRGGRLTVGTEDEPFQHDATIEMHGQLRAPELPIYGAKCLAVREGELNLHGM